MIEDKDITYSKEKSTDERCEKLVKISFRKGLGRILLFWFLFQALIPITFLFMISFNVYIDDSLKICMTIMVCTLLLSVPLLALRQQKNELRKSHAELEKRSCTLQRQGDEIKDKNVALEAARIAIERKARELEITSRYKTEFLANMSHELRTPLNSLLILSQVLSENREGNLTGKQVESLSLIHRSGRDLMGLIDEILDLTSVEAGAMVLNMEELHVREFAAMHERYFQDQALEKNVTYRVEVGEEVPDTITTDKKCLDQVLKNLVANALKFTDYGGEVTVRFFRDQPPANPDSAYASTECLAVSVNDTGIGIAADKQKEIFEAFTQADATKTRKYGGVGLGLSLTHSFIELLGGVIVVRSEEGRGSTFTLYLPIPDPGGCWDVEPSLADSATEDRAMPMLLPSYPSGRCRCGSSADCSADRIRDVGDNSARDVGDDSAPDLAGVECLIIDEDMRTVFTLSNLLEKQGVAVTITRAREEGLAQLEAQGAADFLIADVGVLGEEGLGAVHALSLRGHRDRRFFIALKEEGASDADLPALGPYAEVLEKPVDGEKVLSLLRAWNRAAGRPV